MARSLARDEDTAANGALVVKTGELGRSPEDRARSSRTVHD
jgi:hypothetical protein